MQMQRRCFAIAGAAFLALGAGTAFAQNPADVMNDLVRDYPGVRMYEHNGKISRLYGNPFGFGESPEDTAERFVERYAGVFADDVGSLQPAPRVADGPLSTGVMYNPETGEYKFTAVYYGQFKFGVPVFESDLVLLVRNDAGHPLELAATSLRDLSGLEPPQNAGPGFARGANQEDVRLPDGDVTSRMIRNAREVMGRDAVLEGEEGLHIWAGVDDLVVEPRFAVVFTMVNGSPATWPDYQKRRYIADAETEEILYSETLIHEVTDVAGNVSGNATEGIGADICGPESPMALPYARVRIVGGNQVFADENGDFVIPHDGAGDVTVESRIEGRWFNVDNNSGADAEINMVVTPPGPANFLHNAANSSEFPRAEVNAYVHANLVRDWVLSFDPNYPVIDTQTNFDVNVNLNNNCNAFYDGSSINFFTSGGGCSNTANSTIVYHEYGHHLINVAGSGQGEYGEGMSDTVASLIARSPVLAIGFQNDCSRGIRNADNNCQYDPANCSSCGSQIHACGQLMSGCVWSTRGYLEDTNPDTFEDIIAALTIGSIKVHTGRSITPAITIDFLELDDDDGNIENGTPHYDEIAQGFGDHNMDAPELSLIDFNYPNGLPSSIDPAGGTSFIVEVAGVSASPQPGTGVLHVNTGGGFEAFPMNEITDNVYEAVFPSSTCGDTVEFDVSVETTDGDEVTDPADAPSTAFQTVSATGIDIALEDDFESDMGWTVQNIDLEDGQWMRGFPEGAGRGAPESDFDGSGRGYFTDTAPGNSDVDGGPTRLTSPVLDLSDGADYRVSYARWFTNDDRDADRLLVEVSDDNGATWALVESVGHAGEQWVQHEFAVSDFVTPTNQVRVRFSAIDNPNDSVTEAGIDAFVVKAIECGPSTDLTGFDVQTGTVQLGDLESLRASDNDRLRIRSGFGETIVDLHNVTLTVDAETGVGSPSTIDLLFESRLDEPGGQASISLRNWSSGEFDQVGSFPLDDAADQVDTIEGIDASNYVDGAGQVQVEIVHRVFVPFLAFSFDSFIDQVQVTVN